MKKLNKNDELLEKLQQDTGCTYLSDLHSETKADELSRVLMEIPYEMYGYDEWSEAFSYITKRSDAPEGETVRQELLAFLNNRIK